MVYDREKILPLKASMKGTGPIKINQRACSISATIVGERGF